jgi:hypothetical protein
MVREDGHAAGVRVFGGADGVGGGQAGDERAVAGRGEDAGHGGRDGVVDQALDVGDVDPAVVGQDPVRGAGDGFQPDERGHPGAGHVAVRGGYQQAFGGEQHRFQFGPRHQAGVAGPRVQPQAAVDLVEGQPDRQFADWHRAPPELGPGKREVDLLRLEPDARGESGPRLRHEAVEQRAIGQAQASFVLGQFVHGSPFDRVVPAVPARLHHRRPGVAGQLVKALPRDLDGGDGSLGQGTDVVHQMALETVAGNYREHQLPVVGAAGDHGANGREHDAWPAGPAARRYLPHGHRGGHRRHLYQQ